jgi:hypothetical protein
MNSHLAGLAVPLAGGRGLTVYIGGQAIDPASTIEFTSPYFSVAPNSVVKQDFDDAVSVVSFVVNVHPNTPPGEYTIFLTGDRGLRSCLIGGLTLDR